MKISSAKGQLYRDPERGKIAGVCAGISDYFGFELWLVRIITISGLLFSGSFVFFLYLVGWFILDKKPTTTTTKSDYTSHSYSKSKSTDAHGETLNLKPISIKEKVWQQGKVPIVAIHEINNQFVQLEQRLRHIEHHVTSPSFTVSREINQL